MSIILRALQLICDVSCDKFTKYGTSYLPSIICISKDLSKDSYEEDIIVACVLQDVIKLGIYTYEDILYLFDENIANMVLELTYDESFTKLDKKLWYLNKTFSEGAQNIILSNYLYIIHIKGIILDEYKLIWIWHLVRKMDKANAHIRMCIKLQLDMLINADYDMNDKLQEYLSVLY